MIVGALVGYFPVPLFTAHFANSGSGEIITAIGFVLSAVTFNREFVK